MAGTSSAVINTVARPFESSHIDTYIDNIFIKSDNKLIYKPII